MASAAVYPVIHIARAIGVSVLRMDCEQLPEIGPGPGGLAANEMVVAGVVQKRRETEPSCNAAL